MSGIWRIVYERDKERKKFEEFRRRTWEGRVDQRLFDGRWEHRDGIPRGRDRYLYC